MLATIFTFCTLYLLALLIPGPNTLLLASTASGGDRRGALCMVAGMVVAMTFWVCFAVFGVQAAFAAAPWLQTGLRVLGGLYLIWLAIGMFREARQGGAVSEPLAAPAPRRLAPAVAFRRGFITNASNPKSLAFWASVAAVSFDANTTQLTKLLIIPIAITQSILFHGGWVMLFSTGPVQRAYLRARRGLLWVTGSLMAGFGLRLLWALRPNA